MRKTSIALLLFAAGYSVVGAQSQWIRHTVTNFDGTEHVAVADLNKDGWDDIVYTVWNLGHLRWAANNRNGTFTDQAIATTGLTWARNVEVASMLPGHVTPQILVSAYQAGHFMYVYLSGVWTKFVIENVSYGAAGIAAGAINSDGLPDVVTARQGQAGAPGSVTVWRNLDSGTFQWVWISEAVQDPSSVAIVDVDGDGSNDVIASDSNGAIWWRNMGGFEFGTKQIIADNVGPSSKVRAFDLTRDGVMDFVIASQSTGLLWVNGTARGTPISINSQYTGAYHVDVGYLTYPNDGRPDIVLVTGTPTHVVRVFHQQVNGTFTEEFVADSYTTGRSVAIGDFRHNGRLQFATTSYGGDTQDWWEQQP